MRHNGNDDILYRVSASMANQFLLLLLLYLIENHIKTGAMVFLGYWSSLMVEPCFLLFPVSSDSLVVPTPHEKSRTLTPAQRDMTGEGLGRRREGMV